MGLFDWFFGTYTYKTKKGERWWLHSKQKNKTTIYFFSRDPVAALSSLPKGYEVVESERSGIPFLRKIEKKAKKKNQ
jgi:hypothetical protein